MAVPNDVGVKRKVNRPLAAALRTSGIQPTWLLWISPLRERTQRISRTDGRLLGSRPETGFEEISGDVPEAELWLVSHDSH